MQGKLLVIAGCTGVGKTSLSLKLAEYLNIEIVSADSMQIYKALDIGTSKLTKQEAAICPHHLIDFVSPFDNYNTYQYVNDAAKTIREIWSRGNLPVIVGGTGLYIESLIDNYTFDKNDKELVDKYDYRLLCLYKDRAKMYKAIDDRVDEMIKKGLVNEVITLHEMGVKDDAQCMQAIGYKEICKYLNNETTLELAIDEIKKNSRNYAKRQMTWFRHMKCEWINMDTDQKYIINDILSYYNEYKKTR